MFSSLSKTETIILATFYLSSANALNLFNPFPHNKILDQTKLKAFGDNKLNVTKMIISAFDRVENIVGKGEIACTSNFLLVQAISAFPTMFSKRFFPRGVKRCHCVGIGEKKLSFCRELKSVH